jgi:hypothetical protein
MPEERRRQETQEFMEAFDRLPLESQEDREELRRRCVAAVERHVQWRMRYVLEVFLTPVILVIVVPALVIGGSGSDRARFELLAIGVTGTLALIGRAALHRVRLARVAFGVVGLCAAFQWFQWARAASRPVREPVVLAWGVAGLFLGIVTLVVMARHYARLARKNSHPYDTLAAITVRVAADIQTRREDWPSAGDARKDSSALETLAVQAQLSLALRERVDSADRALRRDLRLEALRVAEAVREHKGILARASGPEAADGVARSLVFFLDAVLRLDREALLAHAPQVPSQSDRVRAALARIVPGVVLIGAGMVLPSVPPLSVHPDHAQTVRWMLLVVGATWVLSANSEASGRVSEVLGKAVPFR